MCWPIKEEEDTLGVVLASRKEEDTPKIGQANSKIGGHTQGCAGQLEKRKTHSVLLWPMREEKTTLIVLAN